jgi:hypothetical protein
MTLIERFLKAKHWQLFLLTFGLPLLVQLIIMVTTIVNIGSETDPNPAAFNSLFFIFPVLMLVFLAVFYGWFWSIAIGLQPKIPAHIKMKTGTFKVFFFIPLAYMLLFSIGIGTLMSSLVNTMETNPQPDPGIILSSMVLVIPLHLFSMFCIFYCLYFVAKTFKTVELQRETTFADFAGEFFMIWFYPIGIWIIQPKVNKMVDATV